MVLAAKADGHAAIRHHRPRQPLRVIDFYEACRKHEMTPIIGLGGYMAANSRFDRPRGRGKIERHRGETRRSKALSPPDVAGEHERDNPEPA